MEKVFVPQVEEFARSLGDIAKVLDRKCGALLIASEETDMGFPTVNAFVGNPKFLIPSLAEEIDKAIKGNGNSVLGIAVLVAIREICEEKAKELIQRLNEKGEKDNG